MMIIIIVIMIFPMPITMIIITVVTTVPLLPCLCRRLQLSPQPPAAAERVHPAAAAHRSGGRRLPGERRRRGLHHLQGSAVEGVPQPDGASLEGVLRWRIERVD